MTGPDDSRVPGNPKINDQIRAHEVRLIGVDGEQLGIKPMSVARLLAETHGLDLVAVADKTNPPVVRVMDYGRFKYETAKRAKESRRKPPRTPRSDLSGECITPDCDRSGVVPIHAFGQLIGHVCVPCQMAAYLWRGLIPDPDEGED